MGGEGLLRWFGEEAEFREISSEYGGIEGKETIGLDERMCSDDKVGEEASWVASFRHATPM